MFVSSLEAPHIGKLDTAPKGGVDAVTNKADTEIVAALEEHAGAEVTTDRIARCTSRVHRIGAQGVAQQTERTGQLHRSRSRPAENVTRMTRGCRGALCRQGAIISTAGVMGRDRYAGKTPLLIDAKVEDGIEDLLPFDIHDATRIKRCGRSSNDAARSQIGGGATVAACCKTTVLQREARRDAAAELPRIGNTRDAVRRGVTAHTLTGEGVSTLEVHIEERPHAARRKPGELQEGT